MEHDAQMDAQTLAEAEVIKADTGRYSAAQSAAGELAKEAEIRAASFDAISSKIYDHPSSAELNKR